MQVDGMSHPPVASASSAFSDLDRHFAAFIEAQAGGDRPSLALAAALVSRQRSEGHICLDLEEVAGTAFPDPPVEGVKPVPASAPQRLGRGNSRRRQWSDRPASSSR